MEIVELQKDDFSLSVKEKGSAAESAWFEKLYAVRIRYSLPKAIGEGHVLTPQHRQDDDSIRVGVNQLIEEVVTALRLCGVESVYVPGVLHKTSKWSFGQSRPFPGQFHPELRFSMTIDDPTLQWFAEFWNTLQASSVKQHKFLATAIRRFGYAFERHRIEDKIIDLLISAEALFLSTGSYSGEVKYRLSLRASLFLATEANARRFVFDRMKSAYDFRSAVAHGATYNANKLPENKDGEKLTLEEFVYQIQEYVRIAIIKMVNRANQQKTPGQLVNWDDLCLTGYLPETE